MTDSNLFLDSETRFDTINTNLSLINGNPVCCGEPLVIFYVIHAILQVAKSLCQVYLKQVSQQILQVGAKVRGESYLQEQRKKGTMAYQARSRHVLLGYSIYRTIENMY